jgi:beta-carotene ketolase (CrtW type)
LFIIGHDAMHRVLWPARPRLNDQLGVAALFLYAGLPYQRCRRLHQRHHRLTARAGDPDFPDQGQRSLLHWYKQFMARYLSASQMFRLLSGWALLLALLAAAQPTAGWAVSKVLIVGTLPLLLSSWQLFLFGTYLPHRDQRPPRLCPHPHSLDLPPWLSLLACYHFGYHREHHEHPQLPWYALPAQWRHQRLLTLTGRAG